MRSAAENAKCGNHNHYAAQIDTIGGFNCAPKRYLGHAIWKGKT